MLRLSLLYTLLDGAPQIDTPHLRAAWAVWQYCRDSAEYIFGDRSGNPIVDKLWGAVLAAGDDGLDRNQQTNLFDRHVSKTELAAARAWLLTRGKCIEEEVKTAGRPRHVLRVAR